MYWLKLLTSPESYLPTPTPDPKFFYANKGCNSSDLTYNCSISVHPYFHVLSAFENQNNFTACTLHVQYIQTWHIQYEPLFHFSLNVEILEKRNTFWKFIQQVDYILTCQIQSSPQFSIFSINSRNPGLIVTIHPTSR